MENGFQGYGDALEITTETAIRRIEPVKPKWGPFSNVFIKAVRYKEWEPFLNFVDVSYWNVELEN